MAEGGILYCKLSPLSNVPTPNMTLPHSGFRFLHGVKLNLTNCLQFGQKEQYTTIVCSRGRGVQSELCTGVRVGQTSICIICICCTYDEFSAPRRPVTACTHP